MDHDDSADSRDNTALGRIPIKQVRVKRSDTSGRAVNPVNLLVPYLDLFWRLADDELGRLAAVEASVVSGLRKQVTEVDRALSRYVDLLPRLTDAELVRLSGATEKTIRFWRLCQPRVPERRVESGLGTRNPSGEETTAPDPVKAGPSATKRDTTRLHGDSPSSQPGAADTAAGASSERRDSKISIDPAAQATVDAMMTFSGAPFPGYDDNEPQPPPPPDEISLASAEANTRRPT